MNDKQKSHEINQGPAGPPWRSIACSMQLKSVDLLIVAREKTWEKERIIFGEIINFHRSDGIFRIVYFNYNLNLSLIQLGVYFTSTRRWSYWNLQLECKWNKNNNNASRINTVKKNIYMSDHLLDSRQRVEKLYAAV